MSHSPASLVDLSGSWQFTLGDAPDDTHRIQLPGSLQAAGFGDEVTAETPWMLRMAPWPSGERYAPYRQPGNIKMPFWLQPEKYYAGAAWYRREMEIPGTWGGKRITLFLERPHIETRVWLDDREIGSNNSLSTPHVYELGVGLAPGRHRLAIRVDNRLAVDVGTNAHSVTDHTQTNWNGIIGRIELRAGAPVWIEEAQVFPDIARKSARLKIAIGNATGKPGHGTLRAGTQSVEAAWTEKGGAVEMEVPLAGDAALWDEFSPVLHRLDVRLGEDTKTVAFGLREAGTRGTQITVNGRPIFLRGTLECCVFPRTGHPPMDVAEWKRILGIIRDYGFNHVRFHSWCPPEAAFEAADELGLYLQIECSSWANHSTELGKGLPVDAWLYEEGHRIVRAYGNHPSFLLMAYGNEPGEDRAKFTEYLAHWVAYWKRQDTRRLHTTAAGWPAIPENDYHNIPDPRIQAWGEGLASRINALPPATTADYSGFVDVAKFPETLLLMREKNSWNCAALDTPRPIVSHEIGQWCAYPDFSEIPKYTGLLKAKNFEIFQETLEAAHLGGQARDFLMASGRLQVLCYKEEIESSLRTNGFGGFQVLQANDFPGQGAALVGWLNAFWESKGYVTPEEFRRFNDSTVLLARLAQRTFSGRDTLRAELEIAHFGAGPLEEAHAYWRLADAEGRVHATGELPTRTIPTGGVTALGRIEIPLAGLPAPGGFRLVAGLAGTTCENDWDVWGYPPAKTAETVQTSGGVLVARDWNELLAQARPGRKILFNPPPEQVKGGVALGFSSIFWNTALTKNQPPHTLGILCDPGHPLFAHFPTEFHSNWQWWELVHGGAAMVLDGLPPDLRPLVQVIDDWFTNRRLGLVFEARFNGCDLLVCASDITSALAGRHAARQFRHSLFEYMAGAAFRPQHPINQAVLERIVG
ncbi:MAG: sugar-binding domain-containing protein [Terrimicrobiaceae bacterium]